MSEAFSEKAVKQKMDKSLQNFTSELSKIRTHRAHPSILDHIKVDYYGNETPLNQVSSITVEGSQTLVLNVWEKDMTAVIEKAIANSDLGLTPTVKGTIIHIPMPPLTEERRQELIKVVRQQAEAGKVAVRNIRRDVIRHLKDAVKQSEISEDEEKTAEATVDKVTANATKEIEAILKEKEQELTTI